MGKGTGGYSSIRSVTVASFFAVSFAAHGGVTEWDAHLRKGQVEYDRGDYQRATASLNAAVKEAEAFGETDERLPLTLSIVASKYLSGGDYAAAEPLLKRSLAIRKKILGPDHPDVAKTMNNLATLRIAQRKYDEAEPLLRGSLEINEKVLGRDHPDVATGVDNLAILYGAQGKYAQADSLFKRAIAIWKKVGDAQNLAMSMKNMETLHVNMKGEAVLPSFSLGVHSRDVR